jgi:hypothetical protein
MASLTDLFNPTFLMFLGILVLVVALVVVYFESKLREQNHKIASMFSIVSTLAEDANGMKMGLNQLMNFNNVIGGSAPENFIQQPLENSKSLYQENTKLIEVSDDDNEDNESDDESALDDDDEIIADESDNESASEVDDNSSLGKYMDDMESEPDSLSDSELQEHVEQEKITVFKLKQDVVNEEYTGTIATNANVSVDFIANDTGNFADNYFFWFLIATFIGVLLMGLYLEFEPTTMILIFIIGGIVVGAAWIGASIYGGFQEDIIDSTSMTKTNVLLNPTYFPVFILVCLILLVVIMYNRKRPGEYQ